MKYYLWMGEPVIRSGQISLKAIDYLPVVNEKYQIAIFYDKKTLSLKTINEAGKIINLSK